MDPISGFSNSYRAILLDFDGTLVDTEFLHHDCWRRAAGLLGLTVSWEDYEAHFVGITDRKAARLFARRAGREPAEDLIDELCNRKHRCYRSRSPHELSLDDGVQRWIERASKRLPLGVVSSSPLIDVEPFLERCGVRKHFRFLVCGEDVTHHKPHPEPYLRALELLRAEAGGIEPGECLVAEDSAAGVQAAAAAGMAVQRVSSPARLLEILEPAVAAMFP